MNIKKKTQEIESVLTKLSWNKTRLIAGDICTEMKEAQLTLTASSLAYTTILSIVPLLAVSFSIFKSFGGLENLYQSIEPHILGNLAENTGKQAMDAIRGYIGNIHAGALGVGGLIGLIFTSMSMLSSAENATNRVWKTTVKRTLFQRISAYWLFITLGPLALAIAVGAASSTDLEFMESLPRGAGTISLTVLFYYGVYKWVPNRNVHWIPALISAVYSTTCWNIAKFGYGIYTAKVVTYSKIYGSLGAIPILLLWMWIIWLIVLSGAALTSALQKRFDLK